MGPNTRSNKKGLPGKRNGTTTNPAVVLPYY